MPKPLFCEAFNRNNGNQTWELVGRLKNNISLLRAFDLSTDAEG